MRGMGVCVWVGGWQFVHLGQVPLALERGTAWRSLLLVVVPCVDLLPNHKLVVLLHVV